MSYWGRKQPPPYTRVNYSYPLSQGLICAVLPDGLGHMYDALRPRASDLAPLRSGGSIGGWTIPNILTKGDLSFSNANDIYTVIVFVNIMTVPASGGSKNSLSNIFYINNTNNGGWGIGLCSPGTNYYLQTLHSDIPSLVAGTISGGTVTVGNHLMIGRINYVTGRDLWVDGIQIATGSTTTPNSPSTNGVYCDGAPNFQGAYTGYVFNRFITNNEIAFITSEPYCPWDAPYSPITTFLMSSPLATGRIIPSFDALNQRADFKGF